MLIKKHDLTSGSITRGLWSFALPLMLGNVLQQFYNLADTWVVGNYIGDNALAAVGSSYTLLTFLTSVVIGLSLGTGSFISMAFGRKQNDVIRSGIFMSAVLIFAVTLVITGLFYALLDPIISALLVPDELTGDMHTYLAWVFVGFFATAMYNYVSNLLRSMGNSMAPLIFLGVSVVLNVGLDLLFVIPLQRGNDSGGRAVPEDGGRVLHRHRHIVYAVRVLPRRQQADDVRCPDCYLAGDEGPACKCAFTHTGNRRFRHMDSYSDRVVTG